MDLSTYKAKPDKSIREHTNELLQNLVELRKLGYVKNEHLYRLTRIACEYHDYGKVNREFQKRINNNTKFNKDIEVAHNVLSLYFLDKDQFKNIEEYYKVGFAILNHHNYCNNIKVIEDEYSKKLIEKLLSDFRMFSITRRIAKNIWKIAEDNETILIKGLLHRCDYSASGGNVIEYKNDFLNHGLNNLLDKWKSKDVDSSWNELQEFCRYNTNNNIIVVAQTGMGKTEAGLHWIGNNKGFFILPLKTAINSIYSRIKNEILDNKEIEYKLALLHSDALSYYNKDNNSEMDIMDYYKQSKQFSMPLSISTVDQLFDFIFKYQGYELKLTTLSYSKVVIDEIQMYGADILAYIICGLKKINKAGGKVAILTATLAPFIKDLLANDKDPIKFTEEIFINDIERHNIKVFDIKIDSNIIYDKFVENRNRSISISNKTLIVCNTVKKAQQIYSELSDKGVANLNILHSKFVKYERALKEEEILKFGKTENISEGIWVTTQIVEASLDIDFDYLFTELSDLSGLFQRLGRCNRKGTKSIKEPNCFIFLEIDKNLLTNGNRGFIDKKMHEISKDAIKNIDGLLTEGDKVSIINKNLTIEKLKGSDYLINYYKFAKYVESLYPYEISERDINFRNIVSYHVIPENIYLEYENEIDENSKELLNPEVNKLRKVELREAIKNQTVPVGIYDIYFNETNAIVKNIKLSKNEFIHVVKCEYNKLGFVRSSKKVNTNIIIEENYDNFF